MIKDAIILSGGSGTRIREITKNEIPKTLVEIKGKPLIEWELELLSKYGVKRAILAIGVLSDVIKNHFENGIYQSKYGEIEIIFSEEKDKLGSGGAIKYASKHVEDNLCYIFNGDVISNANLAEFTEFHMKMNAPASMYLVKMRSPYGIVIAKNNKIVEFKEKPLLDIYIHSGIDIINSELLSKFPDKGQMEDTIFVDLANSGKFAAYQAPSDVYWKSIDTPKDFITANKDWPGLD